MFLDHMGIHYSHRYANLGLVYEIKTKEKVRYEHQRFPL